MNVYFNTWKCYNFYIIDFGQREQKMNILFTGNLSSVSDEFIAKFKEDYKCVAYSEKDSSHIKSKEVLVYRHEIDKDEELLKIFNTFDFETVIFFSHAIDGTVKFFDELESLENVINVSKKHKIKNFIYIESNDLKGVWCIERSIKSRQIVVNACEELCKSIEEEHKMHFMVMRVPYLYSMSESKCQLREWITEGIKEKQIKIRGGNDLETDFLCDEDLGELLVRVLDEPLDSYYIEMNLSGDNGITLAELGEFLEQKIPDAKVSYGRHKDCIPCVYKDHVARREYGWFPKHVLTEDIEDIISNSISSKKKKRDLYERRKRYRKIQEKVRILVEMIVLFCIAEFLNYYTKNNVFLNFIDFRFVFIAIMGTMNGLNPGVASAILSCLGYIISRSGEMQWQILFYNVENWLPFACYFLLGAISGYTRDKHDDEVLYAKEEYEILEKKYIFLSGLYDKVLESKDSFNSQIIGYKDSFGKIYSVVKRLDTTLPDQVFYEAVVILEELLDNYSVAIYAINKNSDFARLNVCSKLMNNTLNKSLKISDYPQVLEALRARQGFVNTDCYENYPAYAAPIHRDGELLGMILLMNSTDRQMNMEFANKFNIISDLISDSLIRALEFDNLSDHYVKGTQILQTEKYKEVLAVKEQMQEKQYLDYILLRIIRNGMEIEELSNQVGRLVRNNDVLGLGEDGEVYLLLSQTRKDDLKVIEERMKKNDVLFEVVKG